MADRLTRISVPQARIPSLVQRGRMTRTAMLAHYRDHYQRQLDEALAALAIPDEGLVVETYTNRHRPKLVTDDLERP